MSGTDLISVSMLVPALAALGIVLVGRWPNVREAVTLLTAGTLFVLVAALVPQVLAGARPTVVLAEPFPGLPLKFDLEPLGLLFALLASFLWIVTSIYSIGYMRGHHEKNQTRFYAFFAVAIASAMAG